MMASCVTIVISHRYINAYYRLIQISFRSLKEAATHWRITKNSLRYSNLSGIVSLCRSIRPRSQHMGGNIVDVACQLASVQVDLSAPFAEHTLTHNRLAQARPFRRQPYSAADGGTPAEGRALALDREGRHVSQ
jgi:hypothetical protein